MLKQALEQAPQNHGVRNIADKKFVKAQNPGFCSDTRGDRSQRIFYVTDCSQSIMDVVHHAMKVNAFFAVFIQTFEKQVHQECFAAPDAPPDIEAPDAVLMRFAVPGKQTEQSCPGRTASFYAPLQVFESFDDVELGRIADMATAGQAVLICLQYFQAVDLPVFLALLGKH
jgi:hypothetical protein